MLSSEEELSAIVALIYDAALDPQAWPAAMGRACAYVGGFQTTMFWQDAADAGVQTLYSHNTDPDYTRLYLETYAPLNPVFPAAFFQPLGSVTAASDLVPDAEMKATRFHKEWMAPQGVTDALGVVLEKDAMRAAFLAIQWKGGLVDDDARRRMTLLVPHFQRAVAIGRLFVRHATTSAALTETLDHIDAGVVLLGARCRIVFANASARRMIDEGTLVHATRGMLRATAQDANLALRDAIGLIETQSAQLASRGVAMTLSEAPEDRWIATILPLADGDRRRAGQPREAIAAVFVRDVSLAGTPPLEMLAALYRLTAGEIRVAETALRISGVDAMAVALGISRATVKTHLNRIYRKCGVKTISDLIRLIAGLKP